MIRTFIAVSRDGEVTRHEEAENAAVFIAAGHTVIEIAPELAAANVRVFLVDEEGQRMDEVL